MKELKAKENGYLTQINIESESDRVYVTELMSITADYEHWRDASESEYQEWLIKYNK